MIFHDSQKNLILKTVTVDSFPITEKQIKSFFKEDICAVKGYFQRRKTDRKQFSGVKDLQAYDTKKSTPLLPAGFLTPPEKRNLIIGYEIGMDIVGPCLGAFVAVFVDKATGIGFSRPMSKSGKHQLPWCVESVASWFSKFKHDWGTLKSDHEAVNMTDAIGTIATNRKFQQSHSPPGEKAYNGLAERYIKSVSNLVTTFFGWRRGNMPKS